MKTQPLERSHDRSSFDCGVEPLNDYLRKYALQNQKKDAARTYILADRNRIVAYYTLVFGSVSVEESTPDVSAGLGRYPIPVILLARLAVHKKKMGQGLGKFLLRDALLRAVRASEIAGLRAFVVHAKDATAKAFYERFGFRPSPINQFHLYLKMADIRSSLTGDD